MGDSKMSSRAVRQFRARNPNQHQLLTGLVVERQLTLLERGAKPYMMRGASPGLDQVDGEERGRAKRRTRGGKTVTWQPFNVDQQVLPQQLLQPRNLNLNLDTRHLQAAQGSDEVGQEGELLGGQGESQWRTIPITRLDLNVDLTSTDLQHMDVS